MATGISGVMKTIPSLATYTLLTIGDGLISQIPALFTFDVLKNRAPELKMTAPRGDQRVSPLQEVAFEAEARPVTDRPFGQVEQQV